MGEQERRFFHALCYAVGAEKALLQAVVLRWYENKPSTTKASITIVAKTGLFKLTRVNHMWRLLS